MLYLNPTFCLIGLFINVLIINCLSNISSDANEFSKAYIYLKVNSYFNLVFILVTSLKILKDCTHWDLFCTPIFNSVYTRYFNIIVVKFLGTSLQTACNIAHVSFTLSRYIIITNAKSKFLVKFNNMSLNIYLSATILFSLLINLYVCFEYYDGSTILQLSNYYKQEQLDEFKENFGYFEYILLNVLHYIKLVLSDLFYILISVYIDIVLVFFVKKRINIQESLVFSNPAAALVLLQFKKKSQKAKSKLNTSKNRIAQMIIFNGLNFFVFKLPLAIYSLHGFIVRMTSDNKFSPSLIVYLVCRYFKFFESLEEFCFFIYLNSFSVQFIVLFKLDRNFNAAFKLLKKNIIKKFKKNSQN